LGRKRPSKKPDQDNFVYHRYRPYPSATKIGIGLIFTKTGKRVLCNRVPHLPVSHFLYRPAGYFLPGNFGSPGRCSRSHYRVSPPAPVRSWYRRGVPGHATMAGDSPHRGDTPIRARYTPRLPSFSGPVTVLRRKPTVFPTNLHNLSSENDDNVWQHWEGGPLPDPCYPLSAWIRRKPRGEKPPVFAFCPSPIYKPAGAGNGPGYRC
jgi:hypothetical protein